jgi:uncharacterized protein (DUF2225 family)
MYVADIAVKCPTCSVLFVSKQLPVLIDCGKRNSELRQHFKGVIPQFEHYAVTTCPSCGRTDWVTTFEHTAEAVTLPSPDITPHIQFRAAAIIAEKEGRDFYNIGLFYLHAAWLADDVNAFGQAREYRKLAASAFGKSLTDGSCPAQEKATLQYLIGETLRRAEEFDKAIEHWRQVIPLLPGEMAMMARKLMYLAELKISDAIDYERQGR